MTNPMNPRPTTDETWGRDVDERLRKLESSKTTRIGEFLFTQVGDQLQVHRPGYDSVVLVGDTPDTGMGDESDRGAYVTPEDLEEALAEEHDGILDTVLDMIDDFFGNIPVLGELVDWITDQFSGVFGLAKWLVGTIFGLPGMLFRVPSGSVTQEVPNQLGESGKFPSGSILPSGGGFYVNLAFSMTDDQTGVGQVDADGETHQLVTGQNPSDRLQVGMGQVITATVQMAYAAAQFTGLGAPVRLVLLRYSGPTELAPVELQAYAAIAPNVASPGVLLQGTYKIPEGVTHVNLLIEVNHNALAGTFQFDNAKFSSSADITTWTGTPNAIEALAGQFQGLLRGLASMAQGIPILDILGVDDAINFLANWRPGMIINQIGGLIRLMTGAFLGRAVDTASAEDLANAIAQSTSIPGVDETKYIPWSATPITGTIPAHADKTDAIAVGAGQDGLNGFILMFGQGGAAGHVGAATWEDGDEYDKGTDTYTVTFLPNGNAKVEIGGEVLEVEAGSGPRLHNPFGGFQGRSVGQFVYNDKTYTGGGQQTGWGAPGISPGGGGAGGRGILVPNGGPGGKPAVWLRFYADSVVIANPSTGTDISPPSEPTYFEVTRVTHNAIYAKAGGAVDA